MSCICVQEAEFHNNSNNLSDWWEFPVNARDGGGDQMVGAFPFYSLSTQVSEKNDSRISLHRSVATSLFQETQLPGQLLPGHAGFPREQFQCVISVHLPCLLLYPREKLLEF